MSLVVVLTGLLLLLVVPNSTAWEYVTVDSAGTVGLHTSLALDSLDSVHVSYVDETNRNLKYATNLHCFRQ